MSWFSESLRKKNQQTDVGLAGVALGDATTSVSKKVMQLFHPPVLRRWENQRMLSIFIYKFTAESGGEGIFKNWLHPLQWHVVFESFAVIIASIFTAPKLSVVPCKVAFLAMRRFLWQAFFTFNTQL